MADTTENTTWAWTWPVTWSDGEGVTAQDHQTGAIYDLLSQAEDFGGWTAPTPNVRRWWDDAQGERGPGAEQPPVVYVWSPTGSTLDRFDMDGNDFEQQDTVEVQVWSLSEHEAEQLQSDVTRILSGYLDDNTVATPYSDVAPVNEEDFREQTPARRTDHYVMSVEIETTHLSATGK